MAKRKDKLPALGAGKENSNVIPVALNGKPEGRRMAEIATGPAESSAAIAYWMTKGTYGETGIGELAAVLRESVGKAQAGDLSEYEGMLGAQAYALNAIFLEMTRRAALNMGEYLPAAEQYMRLALKAQSQARTTIEALAEVKNPRAVAFVKQANIANTQQVNNGEVEHSPRAGAIDRPQNKLLEASNVTRLDTRAQGQAGRGHPPMEAVARVHGAKVARRQGKR